MKRVSFKVAGVLKEAGYPQGHTAICYDTNGVLCDWCKSDAIIDAPYVMEVWLWLWREKRIVIEPVSCIEGWSVLIHGVQGFYPDPEEAIIAAVEYLVDNDLILS